jgi:hypothetical protein
VQHAGHADVVDVAAVAERERRRFVLRSAATDLGRQRRRTDVTVGDRFDRVEDLHVAGAAAEVGTEVWGHRLPGERRALLVDLGLGPHDDAGDAEPALQSPARSEGVGEGLPFGFVDAFERDDRLALDLGEVVLAGDGGLAIDEHRAASALSRRRAAVLRRGDVEFLAQRGEQVRMRSPHRHRSPVHLESDTSIVAAGGGGRGVGEFGHALQFVKAPAPAKATRMNGALRLGSDPWRNSQVHTYSGGQTSDATQSVQRAESAK